MTQATNTTLGEIVLSGDLTGDANFPLLRASGVTAGTYTPVRKIFVDTKGRVTSIGEVTYADIEPVIPIASTTQKGALKIGDNLQILSGVVSVQSASGSTFGAVSVGRGFSMSAGALNVDYSTMLASPSLLGFTKIGGTLSIDGAGVVSAGSLDATDSVKGFVQVGTGVSISSGAISLPNATASQKGVVQVGSGLSAVGGVISIQDTTTGQKGLMRPGTGLETNSGVLSVATASTTQKGLVQAGSGVSISGGVISVSGVTTDATAVAKGVFRGDGVNVFTSAGVATATFPTATASAIGVVQVGSGIRVSDAGTGTIALDNTVARPASVVGVGKNAIEDDGITQSFKTFAKAVNFAPAPITLTSGVASSAAVTLGLMNAQESAGVFSIPGSSNPIGAGSWFKIRYGGGMFVAISNGAYGASPLFYSSDGVNWYSINLPSGVTGGFWDLAYNGSIWIAVTVANEVVSINGSMVATKVTSPSVSNLNLRGIAWNGSVFCAVGADGSNTKYIFTSTNGSSWTTRMTASGSFSSGNPIVWNGTVFVAVDSDWAVFTSPTGTTWTSQSGSVNPHGMCVGSGGLILTSTHKSSDNGVTWTAITNLTATPYDDNFIVKDITYISAVNAYMAVGTTSGTSGNAYGKSYFSTNAGTTWSLVDIREGSWTSAACNGSLIVAVGDGPVGGGSGVLANPDQYRLTAINNLTGSTPQNPWAGASIAPLDVSLTLPPAWNGSTGFVGGEVINVALQAERNLNVSIATSASYTYNAKNLDTGSGWGASAVTIPANTKAVLTLYGYKKLSTPHWYVTLETF